jgi:kynurenine formamidase
MAHKENKRNVGWSKRRWKDKKHRLIDYAGKKKDIIGALLYQSVRTVGFDGFFGDNGMLGSDD